MFYPLFPSTSLPSQCNKSPGIKKNCPEESILPFPRPGWRQLRPGWKLIVRIFPTRIRLRLFVLYLLKQINFSALFLWAQIQIGATFLGATLHIWWWLFKWSPSRARRPWQRIIYGESSLLRGVVALCLNAKFIVAIVHAIFSPNLDDGKKVR